MVRFRNQPGSTHHAAAWESHIQVPGVDVAGAGYRDRTRDPLITNQVLYHLS